MATTTQIQTHQASKPKDQLLRYALRGNGIFSISSGILFLVAASSVAKFLGIQDTEIFGTISGTTFISIVGLLLVPYGLVLFYATMQKILSRAIGMIAVELDAAWVVGSLILLITEALPLTRAGAWSVLFVADIVLVFAIAQYVGVRRMRE